MFYFRKHKTLIIVLIAILISGGCKPEKRETNTVVIGLPAEPDHLNPFSTKVSTGAIILPQLYQSLLKANSESGEFIPVIAESLPEISFDEKGNQIISYKIRKEAKWDDGNPVLAEDVIFSAKLQLLPQLGTAFRLREASLTNVKQGNSEREVIFIFKDTVQYPLEVTGMNLSVMQRSRYDSLHLLDEWSLERILNEVNGEKLIDLGNRISTTFQSNSPGMISGSGPYAVSDWASGTQINLKRKANWWGEQLSNTETGFGSKPEQIIYRVVREPSVAYTALKNGEIDVAINLEPTDFNQLVQENANSFKVGTPPSTAFSCLGMNFRNPVFQDKAVREALARLINYQELIDQSLQGYGERIDSPVLPCHGKLHFPDPKRREYDPEAASDILEKAGWKLVDGIREKVIGGKKHQLKLEYIFPATSQTGKPLGLRLQEAAKKAGIQIQPLALESSVMIKKLREGSFDLYFITWVSEPLHPEMSPLLSSGPGGMMNFGKYSNPEMDQLLAQLEKSSPENEIQVYRKVQELIHKELPMIFLVNPYQRVAISSKFSKGVEWHAELPGFEVTSLE